MKKEYEIIMMKSHKSDLYIDDNGILKYDPLNSDFAQTNDQHLYIISEETIKKGEWFYRETEYVLTRLDYAETLSGKNIKKIIATTNPELWNKTRIEKVEGHFINQPIPKIGIDFIEKYIDQYNRGNKIGKVKLIYEWTGGAENGTWTLQIRSNGTVSISHVEEKYTKKEIKKMLLDVMNIGMTLREHQLSGHEHRSGEKVLNEWIKNNLK